MRKVQQYLVVSGQKPAAVRYVGLALDFCQSNVTKIQANGSRQVPNCLLVDDLNSHSSLLLSPLVAPTTSIVELFPLYQCPPRRHHVGTLGPALRAHDWQCPQLSGANSDRSPSLNPLAPRNKLTPPQRSTTSSSKHTASEAAASPFRLTVAGTATTAVAVGSMAWYYHLFGPTLYAMTPQEEGFVSLRNAQKTVLNMMLGSIQPNTHGNMRNLQRPSTTKRTLLSFSTHYKLY